MLLLLLLLLLYWLVLLLLLLLLSWLTSVGLNGDLLANASPNAVEVFVLLAVSFLDTVSLPLFRTFDYTWQFGVGCNSLKCMENN